MWRGWRVWQCWVRTNVPQNVMTKKLILWFQPTNLEKFSRIWISIECWGLHLWRLDPDERSATWGYGYYQNLCSHLWLNDCHAHWGHDYQRSNFYQHYISCYMRFFGSQGSFTKFVVALLKLPVVKAVFPPTFEQGFEPILTSMTSIGSYLDICI